MLQIFRGVCNVADLPGGRSARGKACDTTPPETIKSAWSSPVYEKGKAVDGREILLSISVMDVQNVKIM